MREHISWAKQLRLENAGAHLAGETAKPGKCGSTSRGGMDQNWKMREHILRAKQLWLENEEAHIVDETAKTGKCGSTSRGRNN